jgi:hypothetical protein
VDFGFPKKRAVQARNALYDVYRAAVAGAALCSQSGALVKRHALSLHLSGFNHPVPGIVMTPFRTCSNGLQFCLLGGHAGQQPDVLFVLLHGWELAPDWLWF